MRRSARGSDLHRLPADYLAKTEIPVDNEERAAIADDASVSIWFHLPARTQAMYFEMRMTPCKSMADEARIDEVGGHDLGFAGF